MSLAPQRTKVLVVDDERPVATTLAMILDQSGYATTTAFNGREAIEKAAQFKPDFLLSDIKMPVINGIDAAMKILEFLPECSVLFISGYASEELLAGARSRGFNFEVCSKPVPPPALLRKIADIIARPSPPPLTILNVDHDEIHRYAVSHILSHAGFTVVDAATGAECLQLAAAKHPDVILLDIDLPDMGGAEVCRELRAHPETAEIAIVHITHGTQDDTPHGLSQQLGADVYLVHPLDAEPLCNLLRGLQYHGPRHSH